MIVDRLTNGGCYRPLHPRIAAAFDFLTKERLSELPAGKQTIDGEHLFALVNDYSTQPAEKCRLEAHRRYVDIQLIVKGIEQIDVANVSSLTVDEPYAPERDIAFFHGQGDRITLGEGDFALFFPQDAHRPGIALAEPGLVRKVVMKVELS